MLISLLLEAILPLYYLCDINLNLIEGVPL